MALVLTNDKHYSDIAAAIRSKNGGSTKYKPEEMAAAIEAIEGSGSAEPNLQYLEVDPARAAHIYEPEEGYDGFSSFRVNGDGDLLPENIVAGVTIFGVEGTAEVGSGEGDSAALLDTIAIDYSNLQSGSFTETVETGAIYTYNVYTDSNSGRITAISTENGDTVPITWEEE